jgi:hypothetical protein
MKTTPLLRYPNTTTWHKSHRLALHNSGALSPVHEYFKRPLHICFHLRTPLCRCFEQIHSSCSLLDSDAVWNLLPICSMVFRNVILPHNYTISDLSLASVREVKRNVEECKSHSLSMYLQSKYVMKSSPMQTMKSEIPIWPTSMNLNWLQITTPRKSNTESESHKYLTFANVSPFLCFSNTRATESH